MTYSSRGRGEDPDGERGGKKLNCEERGVVILAFSQKLACLL